MERYLLEYIPIFCGLSVFGIGLFSWAIHHSKRHNSLNPPIAPNDPYSLEYRAWKILIQARATTIIDDRTPVSTPAPTGRVEVVDRSENVIAQIN